MLNLLFQPYFYLSSLVFFLCIVLPPSIIALPFSKRIRTKLTVPCWNIFFKVFIKACSISRVHIIDRRPKKFQKMVHPPGLYIANHQSFMDIPVLMQKVTIPPVMKKEVIYIPIFGVCAYSSGGILVDRKSKDSRKAVFENAKINLTQNFKALQYYPEGTRQRTGDKPKDVKSIKTPLIKFAYKQNIPVYPVSIWGTKNILQNRLIIPFKKMGIVLNDAIIPSSCNSEQEFIEKCWSKVQDGHTELDKLLGLAN